MSSSAIENVRPYAFAIPPASQTPPSSATQAGGLPMRCVRLDTLGLPCETFHGRGSVLHDGCVVFVGDRSVRAGERVNLTLALAGPSLTGTFVVRRSMASFRPGHEPEYRILLELDEEAGVDFPALRGDLLPDLY